MSAPETITALVAGAVGIVLAIIAVLALDRLWPPRHRREFTGGLPLEKAWQHLARIEQWPSWAKHIKQVELQPAGELGLESTGRMVRQPITLQRLATVPVMSLLRGRPAPKGTEALLVATPTGSVPRTTRKPGIPGKYYEIMRGG